MAVIIEDRVQESTTTTGTGPFALGGAVTACRSFSSVCAIGDTAYVMAVAVDANGAPTGAWESSVCTYSAANTLTRTTINSSSNSGLAVNFVGGTKRVFIDLTAAQIKQFTSSASAGTVGPFGQNAALYSPTPVFSEEFNGNVLNTTLWNKAIFYETDGVVQNFNVSAGNLNIWPDTGFVNRTIDTDTHFYVNPGSFIEARIKLPVGLGVIPAFWLYNHDVTNHQGVNIMKSFCGDTSTPYANASFHPINFQVSVNTADATQVGANVATSYASIPDLSAGFHVYGVAWTATGFTFYYDGVQMGPTVATSALTLRMYILLSVWFGGTSGTPTTASTPQGQSNEMQIDYVRAWLIK